MEDPKVTKQLVFDIETIPGVPLDTVAHLAAKREMSPTEYAALCPVLARVVAVSLTDGGDWTRVVYDRSLLPTPDLMVDGGSVLPGRTMEVPEGRPQSGEKILLQVVNKMIASAAGLVTFNGRSFDIPTLIHRSRINGVLPAPILMRAARQKPWEDMPHVDLLNVCTFGGATQRYPLEAYCLGYGIANPKADGGGENVAAMVAAGDTEGVIRYCLGDIKATAELWRWVNA